MRMKARVLHSVGEGMFLSYHPEGSNLFHAHDFDLVAENVEEAANLLWTLCNVDDANHLTSMRPDLEAYGSQVTAYRQRRNRSLSMGDVLVFYSENGSWLATMALEAIGHSHYAQEPGYEAGSNDEEFSRSYHAWQALLDAQRAGR